MEVVYSPMQPAASFYTAAKADGSDSRSGVGGEGADGRLIVSWTEIGKSVGLKRGAKSSCSKKRFSEGLIADAKSCANVDNLKALPCGAHRQGLWSGTFVPEQHRAGLKVGNALCQNDAKHQRGDKVCVITVAPVVELAIPTSVTFYDLRSRNYRLQQQSRNNTFRLIAPPIRPQPKEVK